jgi:hypothetical protein
VYVLDVSPVSDICCIQVFHIMRVSCSWESQGRGGMGRGESVVGECGARRIGCQQSGARQGGDTPARAGQTNGDGSWSGVGAGGSGERASGRTDKQGEVWDFLFSY